MNIIHSIGHNDLIKSLERAGGRCPFILAGADSEAARLSLKERGLREISLAALEDGELGTCEKEYIRSIARLHSGQDPLAWWTNALSEKNEHASSLYPDICSYYSLVTALKSFGEQNVIVVCNARMSGQLREFCRREGHKFVSVARTVFIRRYLERCAYPVKLVLFVLRGWMHKALAHALLDKKAKDRLRSLKDAYLIRSWISSGPNEPWHEEKDAYFGRLPAHLRDQGKNVVLMAGISGNFIRALGRLRNASTFPAVPEDIFIRWTDYIRIFLWSFTRKVRLDRGIMFRGVDVTRLYQDEADRSYSGLVSQVAMKRYFIGRRCARALPVRTYLQTFENYAWEKAMILGLRSWGGRRRAPEIIGFQHAFISRNSFKYFIGEEERGHIPLPDRIITMGIVTKNILEKHGTYPEEKIIPGCALRQEYIHGIKAFDRRRTGNILVPLTMVRSESEMILRFLRDAEIHREFKQVLIRCHPFAPVSLNGRDLGFELPGNFAIDKSGNVHGALSKADCVAYTWSTVAIEALKAGLPVIYLDLLRPMYVDPLFDCVYLKRTVKRPDEMVPAVRGLYDINDGSFASEQLRAREYLEGYFMPVDQKNLEVFAGTPADQ